MFCFNWSSYFCPRVFFLTYIYIYIFVSVLEYLDMNRRDMNDTPYHATWHLSHRVALYAQKWNDVFVNDLVQCHAAYGKMSCSVLWTASYRYNTIKYKTVDTQSWFQGNVSMQRGIVTMPRCNSTCFDTTFYDAIKTATWIVDSQIQFTPWEVVELCMNVTCQDRGCSSIISMLWCNLIWDWAGWFGKICFDKTFVRVNMAPMLFLGFMLHYIM